MNRLVAKAVACVGGVLSVTSTLAGGVTTVYENDFATRRSAEPVASANWVVSHYAINNVPLTFNYTANKDTISMGDANPWQDGWFKMHRGKTYSEDHTNLGLWYVRDDEGNAYASYSASIGNSQTLHAHPIYNAITCGVIRTTFDIRVPAKVHNNGARLAFTLGTANMMVESTSKADMVTTGTGVMKKSLFEAGFQVNNYGTPGPSGTPIVREEEKVSVMGCGWDYGRDPTTGVDGSKTGPWPAGGYWARVVVEADLDANTYDAWMISLGSTAHPTMDTQSPSAGTARIGRKFYTAYNPSVDGPITGIIFHNVYGGTGEGVVVSGTPHYDFYYLEDGYDDDYAFKMDNIKMEWKAPGKDAFEAFYLNDFNQCQRRTLTPAGTTEQSYAVQTGARTDTFTYDASYVMPYGNFVAANVTKTIVPAAVNNTPNPVGFDGWRRTCWETGAYNFITTCGVHRVLAVMKNTRGWLSQQFGETLTSGKVRLEYDVRAPQKMYKAGGLQQGFVTVCFGALEDWGYYNNPAYQYFRSGMACKGTGDGERVIYPSLQGKDVTSGGDWSQGFAWNDTTRLTSQKWYRMAVTFDLDATPYITASMTCTEIGDDLIGIDDKPVDGARSMTSSAKRIRTEFKGLSTILIGTYTAVSDDITEATLVANLKVTKNVGTANEKVVYKNDFKTRTLYLDDVTTTRLASTAHDRMFEGLDTWQRNNTGTIDAYVTAGKNPALMSIHSGSLGYFAQSIGGHFKRGTYVIRADFRVPDHWYAKDGWCDVLFGNDMLKTGTNDLGSPNNIYNHPGNFLFGMHLFPTSTAAAGDGLCKQTRFSIMCGNSYDYGSNLTVGNWYRCVCTVRLAGNGDKSKTLDVALYDMGTEHPTLETATPETALATTTGRALQSITRAGDDTYHLSTVGIRFRYTANYAFWRNDESGSPLIDNIRIDKVDKGMTVIIR